MRKVIAFHPEVAERFDSIETAIIYQQLCYWQGIKGEGKWFYKTIKELQIETTIKERTQQRCIKKLLEEKVIQMCIIKTGGSPKRHFRVVETMELTYQKLDTDKLTAPDKLTETLDTDKLTETTITEITTETTPLPLAETQFDFKVYLEGMKTDKQIGIRIIGAYYENQQLTFPSKLAVQDDIKRQIRAATKIAKYNYPKKKILDAFDVMSNDKFYAAKGWDLNDLLGKLKFLIK